MSSSASAAPIDAAPQFPTVEASHVQQLHDRAPLPFDEGALIHELVEARAAAHPDALAVLGKPRLDSTAEGGEERVTFRQLNERANQLAHFLRAEGVRLETPVFVLMHRTPLFIVTLLAALKSGASYVPIDPSYPRGRIEHICEQAEAKPDASTAAAPANGTVAAASSLLSPTCTPSPSPPLSASSTDEAASSVSSAASAASSSAAPASASSASSDGFALILTERDLASKVPDLSTPGKASWKLLFIDELESSIRARMDSLHNPERLPGQTSLSCMAIIFTSGSTGKPKGVQIRHRGLHNNATWWNAMMQCGVGDRVSHLANVSFDCSMQETFGTLVSGAACVLCSDEVVRLTPSLYVQWLTRHGVTIAFLPTVLAEHFLEEEYPAEMALKCLYTGGDKLHKGPRPGTKFRFIGGYGPCENTVGVTTRDVPPGMTAPPFNIGRPQWRVQILVMDTEKLRLVPKGTVGEMCVGGMQLARGYFRRPDLTAAAFIRNPYHRTSPERDEAIAAATEASMSYTSEELAIFSASDTLYRTGDLARYTADGSLEFVGRADFQVKIRGNRIELGEIDVVLRTCEGIEDVVVVARSDAVDALSHAGEKRIVAYLVLKKRASAAAGNTVIDAPFLRAFLRDKLPEFMVPSAFVFLEKLPLTPNGKIDREALPAPSAQDLQAHVEFVAPRSEVETVLAASISEILAVPTVSMRDNFWELGGHSLAAAQLIGRVREKLGVELPMDQMFDASSVEELAVAIEKIRSAPPPVVEEVASAAALPVTPSGNQRPAGFGSHMRMVSVGSPKKLASPRLGSSPAKAKSSGLSALLANQKTAGGGAGTSSRAGRSGGGGGASQGLAVPFGAPSLGLGGGSNPASASQGNGKFMKISVSSSDDSDDDERSPYQRFNPNKLPSSGSPAGIGISKGGSTSARAAPSKTNKANGANNSVKGGGSHVGTPSGAITLGSSPAARFKKMVRIRSNDSPRGGGGGGGGSRRGSFNGKFGTPELGFRGSAYSVAGDSPLGPDDSEQMGPNDAPMTYSQQSLHFVHSLDPLSVAYTCVYGMELLAPFDATILRDALHALLIRHASLRTQFCTVADEPVQRVIPPEQAVLKYAEKDLIQALGHDESERQRGANESDAEFEARIQAAWKRTLMKENHKPFDITRGPVFRAQLFTARVPPREEAGAPAPRLVPGISHGVLHLMAHHIAVDGWSMEILVNELYVLYAELHKTRRARADAAEPGKEMLLYDELVSVLRVLPPIGQTMAERAVQEPAMIESPEGERQWSFWQRTLAAPLTLLELPTDFPRPPLQTYKGDVYHFTLPAPLVTSLRALAKAEKVSMFMTLAASFLLLMHRYTGQDDICIGTPMACRHQAVTERTVGHLVNACVLRTNLTGSISVQELLNHVKRMTIAAFTNQDFPFPLLVDRLQSHRDASRNSLFQVMFSLDQQFQMSQAGGIFGGSSSSGAGAHAGTADDGKLHGSTVQGMDQLISAFDMQLVMTDIDGGSSMRADLIFNTSLFSYATMQRMSTHLLELWSSMVADPKEQVTRLALLPPVERNLVLEQFNEPLHCWKEYYLVDRPAAKVLEALGDPSRARDELRLRNRFDKFALLSNRHCVHHLFELQTNYTPAAIAVVEYESFPPKPSAMELAKAEKRRPASLFPAQAGATTKKQEPKCFSYAKLNERANCLAHYMRQALGVRAGDVVVLLFFRCADWLVAMLATLKCGAAYVPVDPAYPSERIQYMMTDAKARVLLTHWHAMGVLTAIHPQVAQVAGMSSSERATAQYRGPFPPVLPGNIPTAVCMIDAQWADIGLFDTINPDVGVTLAHLCYLVYTSGSTGKPKGVMISHKTLYLISRWHQLEYNMSDTDRSMQQMAPAFDPVALELWSTWISGGSIHIVPDSVRSSPPELQRFMLEHRCTVAALSTPVCSNLLDEPWPLPADEKNVPLRVLTCGGDRLPRGPLPNNPLPLHTTFSNHYGPSENTIISTFFHIPAGYNGAPPIGRAVDNVRMYIVDKHLSPVPIGVPGDVYIGGDALAVGYLNRPDLTGEKFVPDVFRLSKEELEQIKKEREEKEERHTADAMHIFASPPPVNAPASGADANESVQSPPPPPAAAAPHRPSTGRPSLVSPSPSPSPSPPVPAVRRGAPRPPPPQSCYPRMYNTGDRGRWLPDGSIDFLGRRDFQVKIRGFRIELGEIETTLLKHARVSKVVVQVKSRIPGKDQSLVAYIVLHPLPASAPNSEVAEDLTALGDELRAFSKQTLAEYMAPTCFVFLPHLPETPNGKIDIKALPEPVWTTGGGKGASGSKDANVVEPRNEIEAKLCGIWCQLLSIPTLSVHDNFFELGGNSLTAARLLSAIKRNLDVELNVSLLFHAPTVAGVAEKIAFMKREGGLAEYEATSKSHARGGSTSASRRGSSAAVVPLSGGGGDSGGVEPWDPKAEIVLDPSICNPRVDFRQLGLPGGGGGGGGSAPVTPTGGGGQGAGSGVAGEQKVVSAIMHHPKALFLTGVTGFLGVHLLAALLEQTSAVVFCLVRHSAKESLTPHARIIAHAVKFKLWDPQSSKGSSYAKRIVPVLGDLNAVRLGIAAGEWSKLCATLDGLIHCGAFVNSVLPYSQLKAANVGGTREVLRLATGGGKIKPLHHISTLSVFQAKYAHRITELEPLVTDGLSAAVGYPASKWVADQLVLAAARRGLPVAIHRPGRITGHSRTGCTSTDDIFTRMLKGCVQLGAIADFDWMSDLTPVDWMASSIVHVATQRHPLPSASLAELTGFPLQPCAVYHWHNPNPIHWSKLAQWLINKHGYPMRMMLYEQWLKRLQAAVAEDVPESEQRALTAGNAAAGIPRIPVYPNVLAPLMPIFGPTRESMGTVDTEPAFNSRWTNEATLAAKGSECPAISDQLLTTYFKYFHSTGFM